MEWGGGWGYIIILYLMNQIGVNMVSKRRQIGIKTVLTLCQIVV